MRFAANCQGGSSRPSKQSLRAGRLRAQPIERKTLFADVWWAVPKLVRRHAILVWRSHAIGKSGSRQIQQRAVRKREDTVCGRQPAGRGPKQTRRRTTTECNRDGLSRARRRRSDQNGYRWGFDMEGHRGVEGLRESATIRLSFAVLVGPRSATQGLDAPTEAITLWTSVAN